MNFNLPNCRLLVVLEQWLSVESSLCVFLIRLVIYSNMLRDYNLRNIVIRKTNKLKMVRTLNVSLP